MPGDVLYLYDYNQNRMYTRRKILLNLISLLGDASAMQLQKMMFLFSHMFSNPDDGPYQFFPNRRGCYSIALSNDYHAMKTAGLLEFSGERYSVSVNICPDQYAVNHDIEHSIRMLFNTYGNMSEKELAEVTYSQKPFYAIRSEIINQLDLPCDFQLRMKSISDKIEMKPRTIYTIGYEGRSIDQLLRNLIYSNIRYLIDVRKNAFSMRREFSKANLIKACQEAGITYMHCPEVGIDSGKRNELLPDGRRKELFQWYSENILPEKMDFAFHVERLLENGSVAFMCYEKNPADCHRSYLASFCCSCMQKEKKAIHL